MKLIKYKKPKRKKIYLVVSEKRQKLQGAFNHLKDANQYKEKLEKTKNQEFKVMRY
jgi:hypothetical protein